VNVTAGVDFTSYRVDLTLATSLNMAAKRVRHMFQTIDSYSSVDGLIKKNEFSTALVSFGSIKIGDMDPTLPGPDLDCLFSVYDKNPQDNQINLDEFETFLMPRAFAFAEGDVNVDESLGANELDSMFTQLTNQTVISTRFDLDLELLS